LAELLASGFEVDLMLQSVCKESKPQNIQKVALAMAPSSPVAIVCVGMAGEYVSSLSLDSMLLRSD
jgi:hypothetical protein